MAKELGTGPVPEFLKTSFAQRDDVCRTALAAKAGALVAAEPSSERQRPHASLFEFDVPVGVVEEVLPRFVGPVAENE